MIKTKVGIINVTGYTGVELARLLQQHPSVILTSITGRSAAGQKLNRVFPHLSGIDLTIEAELGDVELAFSAMPHKESVQEVVPLLERGIRVVDLSADFRLKDADEYPACYDFTHLAPELLERAIYGLPERYRSQIGAAQLVANPGCYATSAILALAPAVKEGIIGPDIIIDSKSGISGAGRTVSLKTHYSEANEDVTAYALSGHRHLPEISQELNLIRPELSSLITFVPHLVPMTRGLLTTAYATLAGTVSPDKKGEKELIKLYQNFYQGAPFIKVLDFPPHTRYTQGSNLCLIYPTIDRRTGRFIVISCLDNLVKGAAGQAVQNMNLMLGLPEISGLDALVVYP